MSGRNPSPKKGWRNPSSLLFPAEDFRIICKPSVEIRHSHGRNEESRHQHCGPVSLALGHVPIPAFKVVVLNGACICLRLKCCLKCLQLLSRMFAVQTICRSAQRSGGSNRFRIYTEQDVLGINCVITSATTVTKKRLLRFLGGCVPK